MFVVPWVWGWNFVTRCVLVQSKITGQSHQILFERLPPQTQDLHRFVLRLRRLTLMPVDFSARPVLPHSFV